MREGWKEVTIGDLGQVITGNTPPKKDADNYGGSYPFIKPTDMDIDRRYVTSWEENYSDKAFKRYKNSYIPPKATGVVTIGTVGEKMFQADQYCFTNQSVNVVIPSKEYDENFIYYLLKYNLPKVENANPGTASGRHHVSKSNFCAIKLRVPPLPTQRKIASILSAYDDLIENNLKRIKLLEEKAQLTYEEWFVKMRFPGYETAKFDEGTGLPEGWENGKIGDLLELQRGFDLPNAKRENGTVPIYASTGIAGYHSVSKVDGPGIVTGRSGTLGQVQYIANNYWPLNTVLWVKTYKNCKPLFVLHFLRILDLSRFGGGSAVPSLDRKVVHSQPISIPSKTLISKFEKICEPLYLKIENLQNQNRLLKEARDILLPRLMSGMVDVDTITGQVGEEMATMQKVKAVEK